MQFRWIQGTVRLELTGLGMDGLVAEARCRGLVLYDLKRPARMQLCVTLSRIDARQLMTLAEERNIEVRVRGCWGLPALWLRVLTRPALTLSLLVCLCLLMLATGRVWEIRVVGAEGSEAREIQNFLAEEGLTFGASTGGQNINALEYKTRQAFPQLRFVGIRLAGVRATVTVAHAIDAGGAIAQGSSVTAARSGVIVRVTPSQGTPRVKPGDVVAQGQLLIEGVMEYPEGDERQPRLVTAGGEVIARVWVSAQASGSLTRVEADSQGSVAQEWTLILGSKRLPLSVGIRQGDMLLESVEAWRLPGFAAAAPFALEKRQYRQGILTETDYDALLDSLRSQSGAEALRLLPPDAQVDGRKESITVENGIVTLTTRLEALCDIGEILE